MVDELAVSAPTRGIKYEFACKCWLAKDRGDGLTSRVFNMLDAETISITRKVVNARMSDKINKVQSVDTTLQDLRYAVSAYYEAYMKQNSNGHAICNSISHFIMELTIHNEIE